MQRRCAVVAARAHVHASVEQREQNLRCVQRRGLDQRKRRVARRDIEPRRRFREFAPFARGVQLRKQRIGAVERRAASRQSRHHGQLQASPLRMVAAREQAQRVFVRAAAVGVAHGIRVAAGRDETFDDGHRVGGRALPPVFEAVGADVVQQRAVVRTLRTRGGQRRVFEEQRPQRVQVAVRNGVGGAFEGVGQGGIPRRRRRF